MDWSIADVATAGVLIGGIIVVMVFARPVWRQTRRVVALVDVLGGRPPRYDHDPEAMPGIVERLDRHDRQLECLLGRVDDVRDRVKWLEQGINGKGTRDHARH